MLERRDLSEKPEIRASKATKDKELLAHKAQSELASKARKGLLAQQAQPRRKRVPKARKE
jgi:hypothetical protein